MKLLKRVQDKKRDSFLSLFFLKKSIFLLVIFCFLLFGSGCTDSNSSGNGSEIAKNIQVNESGSKAELVEVTNLSQVDEALNKGPVVLKLGSKECIPCKEQEQVLSKLLPVYQNSASTMLIDVNEYPEFADQFGVRSIPDTCVIANIKDGKYMYMRPDGSTSLDRTTARFLGVTDEETLSETLDKAIAFRKTEG